MVADQEESTFNPAIAFFVLAITVIGISLIRMDKAPPKKFSYRKTKRKRA